MLILIGNIFTFLGGVVNILSTLGKNKKTILIVQSISNFLDLVGQLFLAAYSGVAICVYSICRNILCAFRELKVKTSIFLVTCACFLVIIVNRSGLLGLLPMLGTSLYTVDICFVKDVRKFKLIMCLHTIPWIVYSLVTNNYSAVFFNIMVFTSTLIQYFKLKKNDKA